MKNSVISKVNWSSIWDHINLVFAKKTDLTSKADVTALDGKVDKVDGKGLSTNDFDDAQKAKLDEMAAGAEVNILEEVKVNGTKVPPVDKVIDITVPTKLSDLEADVTYLTAGDIVNKVDKVEGKDLSTNDYTTEDKDKLAAIDAGAEVNVIESVKVDGVALTATEKAVNIDLSGKVDKEDGKSLFSGKYTDLTETPNIADEALTAFSTSTYATDLATIKGDYITSSSLATAIAAAGHIKFEFADTLPETGVANTIYFIKEAETDAEAGNAYAEYVYNNSAWEKVGAKKVDFSSVWTKDELVLCTNEELDELMGV